MAGNFTVSLLEILAYLIPGGIMLSAIIHFRFPELIDRVLSGIGSQIAFVACSYVVGHLLTFASTPLVRVRVYMRRLGRVKPRKVRMPFYEDLQTKLQSLFGANLSMRDDYHFALRLVTDNQPQSSLTIDRLYAMTLFSRNTSLAFLLIGCLFWNRSISTSLGCGVLAVLFFLRYIQLEATALHTVFRAAYVYLCSKEESEEAAAKSA